MQAQLCKSPQGDGQGGGAGRQACHGCRDRGDRGGLSKRLCAGDGDHLVGRAYYSVTELEHMMESIHEHLHISGAE